MIIKGAENSVTIVTTSKGVLRKIEALTHVMSKLSKKGVKIRIAAPITKESKADVKEVMKFAEVRDISSINARFCIVDGKELMFMVMDDKDVHPSYDIGIWINTPYFSNALEGMFDVTWDNLSSSN